MSAAKVQIKIEKCIYLREIFPIQTIHNLFFPKDIFFKYTKKRETKQHGLLNFSLGILFFCNHLDRCYGLLHTPSFLQLLA